MQLSTSEQKIGVKVKLIKIQKSLTRCFLDRYCAIINPYGSVYPEADTTQLTVWNSILNYVIHGGIITNVADIPFYWAYDSKRDLRYDQVKFFPVMSSQELVLIGPYWEVPFVRESRIVIINTETVDKNPPQCNLKLKDKYFNSNELGEAIINRAVVVGSIDSKENKIIEVSHIESIVEEIEWRRRLVTPICFIRLGNGRFLTSLLFLGHPEQPNEIRESVTKLLSYLTIKELRKAA